MSKKIRVTKTTIDGKPTEFLAEPRQSLLEVLRDELHLTGAKEGWTAATATAVHATSSSMVDW